MSDAISLDEKQWFDAQVGVIGSVLIDPDAVAAKVISETSADDYTGVCRTAYRAIVSLFQDQQPIDPVTVMSRMGEGYDYKPWMLDVMKFTPTTANVDAYIAICKEKSRHLRLVQLAMQVVNGSESLDEDRDILAKMNALTVEDSHKITTAQELVDQFMERHNGTKPKEFLDWGFDAINDYLDIPEGKFVVLGGYPSDGKSALMLQMAKNQSAKLRVGIFSLETDDDTIGDRLMSHAAHVGLKEIIRDQLPRESWQQLTTACSGIYKHTLEIVDAAGMKASDITATAIARNYQVIYVDYLQLVEPENPKEIRSEQVAQISRQLQRLAKRQKITVVALSQLSRPEAGKNGYIPAPTMRSFRESGQIEQDADVALLLYKQDSTDPQSDRTLMIAKNKEGQANIGITMQFDGSTQTFSRSTHAEIRRLANKAKRETAGQVEFSELEDANAETVDALP